MIKLLSLLVVCLALSEAFKISTPRKNTNLCRNFLGKPVKPGKTYYPVVCNKCICGASGKPNYCTLAKQCTPYRPKKQIISKITKTTVKIQRRPNSMPYKPFNVQGKPFNMPYKPFNIPQKLLNGPKKLINTPYKPVNLPYKQMQTKMINVPSKPINIPKKLRRFPSKPVMSIHSSMTVRKPGFKAQKRPFKPVNRPKMAYRTRTITKKIYRPKYAPFKSSRRTYAMKRVVKPAYPLPPKIVKARYRPIKKTIVQMKRMAPKMG